MTHNAKRCLTGIGMLMATCSAAQAADATATPGVQGLQEVIVTAEKRSENEDARGCSSISHGPSDSRLAIPSNRCNDRDER